MNLRVFYLTRRGLSDGYREHPYGKSVEIVINGVPVKLRASLQWLR